MNQGAIVCAPHRGMQKTCADLRLAYSDGKSFDRGDQDATTIHRDYWENNFHWLQNNPIAAPTAKVDVAKQKRENGNYQFRKRNSQADAPKRFASCSKVSADIVLRELGAGSAQLYRHLYGGLLKEPLGIAAENLRDLLLHLLSRNSYAIDDPAQVSFIDSYQPREPILTHASRIDTEFQVWIDAPLSHCHGIGPGISIPLIRPIRFNRHVLLLQLLVEADLENRALNKKLPSPFGNSSGLL